ncbi:unnamed protein product [Bacillus thuringiensis DB27]|uniref:Uncharacterized protein n=1 Tax=Bacillus thuringiensis DB27 TaxID=1431339 RepID=W8ZAM7_BACTU|nr:unnamed protein product [Bacillus thuringiensis DB27]
MIEHLHAAFFTLYRRRTNVFGYIIVCGNKGGIHTNIISSVPLPFLLCANIWFFIPIKNECNKKRRMKSSLQQRFT